MENKTKWIITEIGILLLLTVFICRYVFKYCWLIIEKNELHAGYVSLLYSVGFLVWVYLILRGSLVKSNILKIALIYPALLIMSCLVMMVMLILMMPA